MPCCDLQGFETFFSSQVLCLQSNYQKVHIAARNTISRFINPEQVSGFRSLLVLHYKVICTQDFAEIFIYSSENQCWSTYSSPFDPRGEWFFLNGSMYCLYSTVKSLRFDVYTEKMEQITMPPWVGRYVRYDLHLIGSRVNCTFRKGGYLTADLQVVEMSSDFSEWVPKYHVSVTPLLSAFPEIKKTTQIFRQVHIVYRFNAICVVDGVKEDESDLVLGIPEKLILYNLKKKMAKELCKLHDEPTSGYMRAQVCCLSTNRAKWCSASAMLS